LENETNGPVCEKAPRAHFCSRLVADDLEVDCENADNFALAGLPPVG
jgi:hypothetical protein